MAQEVNSEYTLPIMIRMIGAHTSVSCRHKGEMARGYCEEDPEERNLGGRASEDFGAGYATGCCDTKGGGCAGGSGTGGFCMSCCPDGEGVRGLMAMPQNLPILPALLQASMLALLSTSIPLSRTLTSTFIAVDSSSQLVQDPSIQQLREAESVHVLAFSSHGDLLVVESEGEFDIDIWEAVVHKAKQICRGDKNDDDNDNENDEDEDENMNIDSEERRTLEDTLRDTIREKVAREQRWKESLG